MESNQHYTQADDVNMQSIDAYAVVQATLALAYEQHTANLIAFYATLDARKEVYAEIVERLGL